MSQAFDVAVLGATGLVGQTMIELLEERDFPVNKLYPLASKRSAGSTVSFKGEDIEVLDADEFDWSLVQFGFSQLAAVYLKSLRHLPQTKGVLLSTILLTLDMSQTFRWLYPKLMLMRWPIFAIEILLQTQIVRPFKCWLH